MALSVKTREHIRRWAALAGPKWGALLGGAAALAAAIAFTGSALHFTTVADTHGNTVRILTAATDLAAVLQQSGTPPLGEHDEAVWSQTEDGERLDVLRAYTVPVTADGAMQELTVTVNMVLDGRTATLTVTDTVPLASVLICGDTPGAYASNFD